jgi:ParB family transcriptional regulator, chromosome partitioning protein
MTTNAAAAEKVAGQGEISKEKVEKRRALGRGLESLLPGPRVVGTAPAQGATDKQQVPHRPSPVRNDSLNPSVRNDNLNPPVRNDNLNPSVRSDNPNLHDKPVRNGSLNPPVWNDSPNLNDKPVRNDSLNPPVWNDNLNVSQNLSHRPGSDDSGGEPYAGTIQAVADDGLPSPPLAKGAKDGAPSFSSAPAAAELRSAGPFDSARGAQPGAAVPTQSHSPYGSTSPLLAKDARNGAPGGPVLSEEAETITIFAQAETRMPGNLVVNLDIADIDKNPFQTRYVEDNDALEELADSIRANGVVQPIMVRPAEEEGRYILVLGERRLRASTKAGKTTIPALVRRISLQQAAEMTIIENLQREDLSALEQAEAFRVLSKEFSLTQQQIGERVGLSRESVANYMRLLKLPREVMQLLAEKKITFGEAKELLKLSNDDQISKAALYAVKKGMTLEQVEKMVLSMNGLLDPFPGMPGEVVKKKSGARWVDPNVRAAQTDLEQMLGVKVRIRDRKGKGRIVIEYHTVNDYERVVEMLRGKK